MTDKGAELNQRVWTLFEKAGFETKPNSNDPKEEIVSLTSTKHRTVDLSATVKELGVKIIGENKAKKTLTSSVTTHIHDYEKLRDRANADSVLFVSTEKEVSKDDRKYAEESGMRVWGTQELEYYETVADTIGEYAKYEIIHSFGIETSEEKNIYNVLALRLYQPFTSSQDVSLFLFTITPEKLLKTCVIYRRAQGNPDAYQRILRKERLQKIRKFVTQDNALLPPNIIVHLGENVTWDSVPKPKKDASGSPITLTRAKDYDLVVLKLPMEYASLELLDGQHRLFGFFGSEPATKDNFNLVVLIAGLPSHRKRDTFVAINDNARRMDPNLVAYLKYTDDEKECQSNPELMAIKIVVELNATTPFKNRIRLLETGAQKITLKGFAGYDLKGLIGPNGLMRKYYSNDSKEFISALRLYFGLMKSLFRAQWQSPGKYIIFTNRGISAFLKLLKSILKNQKGPLDKQSVEKYLKALKSKRKDRDWETEELSNAYVGSKGWKDFHRDLVKTIRETYPKFRE